VKSAHAISHRYWWGDKGKCGVRKCHFPQQILGSLTSEYENTKSSQRRKEEGSRTTYKDSPNIQIYSASQNASFLKRTFDRWRGRFCGSRRVECFQVGVLEAISLVRDRAEDARGELGLMDDIVRKGRSLLQNSRLECKISVAHGSVRVGIACGSWHGQPIPFDFTLLHVGEGRQYIQHP